jgi:hypothetical protein
LKGCGVGTFRGWGEERKGERGKSGDKKLDFRGIKL